MPKPETPHGYAIFCDDIRQEVANKVSLIGLYSGVLTFDAEFPITLPKLCIAANWTQSLEDEVRPVTLKVIQSTDGGDDQVMIEGPVPMEHASKEVPKVSGDATQVSTQLHIALSPLTIEGPGYIRVRVYYGDEEYRLGSLRTMQAQDLQALMSKVTPAE